MLFRFFFLVRSNERSFSRSSMHDPLSERPATSTLCANIFLLLLSPPVHSKFESLYGVRRAFFLFALFMVLVLFVRSFVRSFFRFNSMRCLYAKFYCHSANVCKCVLCVVLARVSRRNDLNMAKHAHNTSENTQASSDRNEASRRSLLLLLLFFFSLLVFSFHAARNVHSHLHSRPVPSLAEPKITMTMDCV